MAGAEHKQGRLKQRIRICAILVWLSFQQTIQYFLFTVQMAKQCLGNRLANFVLEKE